MLCIDCRCVRNTTLAMASFFYRVLHRSWTRQVCPAGEMGRLGVGVGRREGGEVDSN